MRYILLRAAVRRLAQGTGESQEITGMNHSGVSKVVARELSGMWAGRQGKVEKIDS